MGEPAAPVPPSRVILIDGCSGIQFGEDNDQVSVYTVRLPAQFTSATELAGLLLSDDVPWARDVFSHDAALRPPPVPERPDADFSETATGPSGRALVLVRNSSGVQVGHHNVQRNAFRIVMAPVAVTAGSVAVNSARSRAVSALHADPADRGAARQLAQNLADAAEATVVADLTATLQADVGSPRMPYPAHEAIALTGRQFGTRGKARVKLEVTVTKFDTSALTTAITTAARAADGLRRLRETADLDEAIARATGPLAAPADTSTTQAPAALPLSSPFSPF